MKFRAHEFQNVLDGFGLMVTNASGAPWEDEWTFQNSMGVRRKLDYIMISRSLHLVGSSASNQSNLGSDHKVVRSVIVTGTCRHNRTRKKYR